LNKKTKVFVEERKEIEKRRCRAFERKESEVFLKDYCFYLELCNKLEDLFFNFLYLFLNFEFHLKFKSILSIEF
jgi:hypothetical protein